MADNNQQQSENQNAGSPIDKTVDNAINSGIDNAANRIPQGQKFEQAAKDKADQAANGAIDNEAKKGASGIAQDAKGLFDKKQQ